MTGNNKGKVADERKKERYPRTPQSILNRLGCIDLIIVYKFSGKLDWRAGRKRTTQLKQGGMNCSKMQEKRHWNCCHLNPLH